MDRIQTVDEICGLLALEPHPEEGGFFRETYRSEGRIPLQVLAGSHGGERSHSTAIYYLLSEGSMSAMHRLVTDEVFHFYLGDPVEQLLLHPDGRGEVITLGNDLLAGQRPQQVVPAGVWQGAVLRPGGRLALLGCTVAPGFEYADYTHGDRGPLTVAYPDFAAEIRLRTSTPGVHAGRRWPSFEQAMDFHGHACPGLAIGYRMSIAALEELVALRARDEDLVALVENDACAVDALQFLSGCTAGKGNLIFLDHGKMVFTLFSRASGKGVRVHYHGRGMPPGTGEHRSRMIDWILAAGPEEMLELEAVEGLEPPMARIHRSVPCDACGEDVMETRIREVEGRRLCVPCSSSR